MVKNKVGPCSGSTPGVNQEDSLLHPGGVASWCKDRPFLMTNTGKLGEDLAHQYLKDLGYKILIRNFRIRGGEIDMIATDGDTLVFIEVKTRSTDLFGTPEDAINYHKLRFIERAGKFFRLGRNNLPEAERIDVIAVDLGGEKPKIRHIKNAGFWFRFENCLIFKSRNHKQGNCH